jgi:hypothetical protein
MIQYGVFEVPEIKFPKGGESDAKSIRLHLSQIDKLEPDGYPISGTFRSTVEEPDLSSTQSTRRESLPSNKLPTSSPEKGQTRPPDRLQNSRGPIHLSTPAPPESGNLPATTVIAKPNTVLTLKSFFVRKWSTHKSFLRRTILKLKDRDMITMDDLLL